ELPAAEVVRAGRDPAEDRGDRHGMPGRRGGRDLERDAGVDGCRRGRRRPDQEPSERNRDESQETATRHVACPFEPVYSPITDQSTPIMMKKPTNSAIRPRPPYGEFAPSCGTSCRPIPNTTAQARKAKPNRYLVVGLVMNRLNRLGPSAVIADRRMISSITRL